MSELGITPQDFAKGIRERNERIAQLESRNKLLEDVLSAAGSLISEMENEAEDLGEINRLPTHFTVWFILKEAIAAARSKL